MTSTVIAKAEGLEGLPYQTQRSDAVSMQLTDVIAVTRKIGCGSAALWLDRKYRKVEQIPTSETKRLLDQVTEMPHRCDSLSSQMQTAFAVAKRLGFFTALDSIELHWGASCRRHPPVGTPLTDADLLEHWFISTEAAIDEEAAILAAALADPDARIGISPDGHEVRASALLDSDNSWQPGMGLVVLAGKEGQAARAIYRNASGTGYFILRRHEV